MSVTSFRALRSAAEVDHGTSTLDYIGLNPPALKIQKWFKETGYTTRVIGKSIKGQDLRVYRKIISPDGATKKSPRKSILFMSLVHGNEPLGLMSLLRTAEALAAESFAEKYKSEKYKIDLLFFPIVNIDAYELNLEHGSGCRRTNLKHSCKDTEINQVKSCPYLVKDGVDLNRNFPLDFDYVNTNPGDACMQNYPGVMPFSEPESRAIKDLVLLHKFDAAINFHSWADSNERPLIYYPYTSHVPHIMDKASKRRFKHWANAMNPTGDHLVGLSKNVAGFTERGSVTDWMFSQGVMSFVHEAATPCGSRWCDDSHASQVKINSLVYAKSSMNLVDMVMDDSPQQTGWHIPLAIMIVAAVFVANKYKHWIASHVNAALNKGAELQKSFNVAETAKLRAY